MDTGPARGVVLHVLRAAREHAALREADGGPRDPIDIVMDVPPRRLRPMPRYRSQGRVDGLCRWCRRPLDAGSAKWDHPACRPWIEANFGTFRLARPPLGCDCAAAQWEIDHIRPLALAWTQDGPDGWTRAVADPGNRQRLCRRCHSRKTAHDSLALAMARDRVRVALGLMEARPDPEPDAAQTALFRFAPKPPRQAPPIRMRRWWRRWTDEKGEWE